MPTYEYKLSIVIPVYRSSAILPKLVQTISDELHKLSIVNETELILVNDASPDQSWSVIKSLSMKFHFLKGVSLRKNFGQHNATMAGLNYAKGRIVVIMDDDLQHPPQAISEMLDRIEQGYDVCYTRYGNRQHAAWKKIGSRFNDLVATYLLEKPSGIYLSSFKALRMEVVKEVIKYDGPYAYLDGLILNTTRSITAVDIEHQARLEGKGNYNLRKSLSLWLKMATSFSVLPLRIATLAGFLLSAISLIMLIFIIVDKLLHPEISAGWTSIMTAILFIGGIQTLCIGLLGEYLGRAYLNLNHKPQFVVSSLTWSENAEA